MRKKIALLLSSSFLLSTLAFAQNTAPQAGGIEALARKVLGSGFVEMFINGGVFMWPILFVCIYGIAYVIWKFISLQYAKINLSHFLANLIPLIEKKKYKEAIELCQNTRGPVGMILYAGLLKVDQGIEAFEKAVEGAGMIEMSYLEKGFTEIGSAITLAPMLGFLGTVAGMIQAFDAIAKAGSVEPTIVASGIKVALITTAAGLIIAIPIQLLNNIYTTMVDGLVIDMQRASDKVVEALVENK